MANTLPDLDAAIAKARSILVEDATPTLVGLAQSVERLAEHLDPIEKTIQRRDGKYCVIGSKTGKNFGCYGDKSAAERRLAQIERFSKTAADTFEVVSKLAEAAYGDELPEDTASAEDVDDAAVGAADLLRLAVEKRIDPDIDAIAEEFESALFEFFDEITKASPPKKGLDREKLRQMQAQRSSQYGIEVLQSGSNLSFPSGDPEKLEQYGDPVNLKYRVDDAAHAKNARARFKQNAGAYKKTSSKRVVHTRIVEAELKFGVTVAIDPKDPLDKLLPASLRQRATSSAKKNDSTDAATEDATTLLEKQAPAKGAERDKLVQLQKERSQKYGIEVIGEGSNLTFPAGYPTKLELYGDPVNLKFPTDTPSRAAKARVRVKAFAGRYTQITSKRVVHTRIVEAELKHGIQPDFDKNDALDKLLPSSLRAPMAKVGQKEASLYGSDDRKRRRRRGEPMEKGLPANRADWGIHIHGSERENAKTKRDGQHEHVFVLQKDLDLGPEYGTYPAGAMFYSDEDGAHEHKLAEETANETAKDGAHFHRIRLPGGRVIETSEDGMHRHQMQMSSTAFDGGHQHILELPNQKLKSLTPGEMWDLRGSPAQEHMPLLPPASTFAWLSPNAYPAMGAMRGAEVLKRGNAAERSGFRKGELPVMKVQDPEFVLARLNVGKSAGIVSTRARKSRVGEAHALVNEVSSGKFDKGAVWAFVSYGESELFKSLDDMPEDVRSGIEPHAQREFEGMPDVYYIPLRLLKVADPILRLREPVVGGRFAPAIDLEKDIVSVAKCASCDNLFEAENRELHVCATCRKSTARDQAGPVSKKGDASSSYAVRIIKAGDDDLGERYIKGAVLVPDEADAQGDIYDREEIRKAAHGFMERSKGTMKIMHKGEKIDDLVVLETYLSVAKEKYGSETYPVGTWLMGFRASDEVAKAAREGEFTGLSIGGSAVREPLDE